MCFDKHYVLKTKGRNEGWKDGGRGEGRQEIKDWKEESKASSERKKRCWPWFLSDG